MNPLDKAALDITLDERSKSLRRTIVAMMDKGGRGHLGSAFSLVEILRVLYDDFLHYDPKAPRSSKRDRCILSKGHGCLALYAILADKGFIPENELWNFCKHDGMLGGHPEAGKIPGVEASTGSLGHGLSIAVGMALSAKIKRESHKIVAVISDGESNEGSTWEAALSAAKHKLSNLHVLVDYNKQQSYGSTYEVLDLEPFLDKWKSFGFAAREINGHSPSEIKAALSSTPFDSAKPSLILCHTIKGKGVSFAQNNPSWHHKNKLPETEIAKLMEALS